MRFPYVNESMSRLRRAGGASGFAQGALWLVTGTNGENAISASAPTQAGAWWAACVQAREVGMLAPEEPPPCSR